MAQRNEVAAKTARKALRDISNKTNSKKIHSKSNGGSRFSTTAKKKNPNLEEEEEEVEDDSLDSLLLVQSDLSAVVHQIDELVARAFKVNTTSKHGRSEIKSFKRVLSDMLSTLKPWVSRFEKALTDPPMELENQLVESPICKTIRAANADVSNDVGSPDETDVDSLISPSPLVSWRGDCTIKRGRQLFVLTPMPIAKGLSSRHQESARSVFERIASNNTIEIQSLYAISGDTNDDLLEGVVVKPTPRKASDLVVTETRRSHEEEELPSPAMFSKRDHSFLVMTPRLKMSPPKSCVMLEPISECSHQDNIRARKSTPYPVRTLDINDSDSSETSRKETSSENLALKYPELLGIQQAYKAGTRKKAVEESSDWFMSPPKSCILMEPPDEKSLKDPANEIHQQTKLLSSLKETDVPICHQTQKSHDQGFALESTPMWKGPESTIRRGKPPGENTLKKELWTRFEAATTNKLSFNAPILPRTMQKGFLDLLEEVSCDESSPVSEGLMR